MAECYTKVRRTYRRKLLTRNYLLENYELINCQLYIKINVDLYVMDYHKICTKIITKYMIKSNKIFSLPKVT